MTDRGKREDLGRRIVAAWNAGRLDDVMDAYADEVRMASFSSDGSGARDLLEPRSKAEIREILSGAMGERPNFEILSSSETDDSISLVLMGRDGKVFTVAFTLNSDRKITSVMSLRTQG